jgi:hypothetical protein
MARFVQFPTIDGGTILVEAAGEEEVLQSEGVVKAGLSEKVHHTVLQARETFEEAVMETVRRNADAFVRTMRTLAEPPSEAELAFGVKVTGEAGYSAVAKAGAESSYTVTLTWKRDKEEKESK